MEYVILIVLWWKPEHIVLVIWFIGRIYAIEWARYIGIFEQCHGLCGRKRNF
ncbi:hypothetical protein HanRHA438_Chr16g0778251 [Helianthus annuus]|nr:hypothetical protein HanRHA438_Chr16g0778251 [Helianthus annuus]